MIKLVAQTKTTWGKVRVEEVAKNFDSKRVPLSSMQRAKMRGEFPYYGAAEIVDHINDYIYDGLYLLIAEDGTVTAGGNRPMLQLVNGKFWVNNHAHILQGNNDLATKYLFYALKNTPITPYITGAVQLKLTQENLNKIGVPYPEDGNIRDKITSILSAFDDKIELNNKISRTLEQMAQAIFKEWFVKKTKFKNQNAKLETICDIVYGKDLPTRNLMKYGFPVYGGNGIIGYSDKYLYSEPQIIIGCRGAYSGNIFKTEPKSFVTHNSLILKIKKGRDIGVNYLFYALQKSNVKSSVTGSAQPQITITELNQVSMPISDENLMREFENMASVIEYYKFKVINENQKLAALRDLLLPKLMHGEIEV